MKLKNVLVTGGAGYIGTETLYHLQRQDYRVIVADNLFRGFMSEPLAASTFYKCDLTDLTGLEKIFSENSIDVVLHLAALALVGESNLIPEQYLFNNIQSTKNLLSLCEKYRVDRFILASSSTVYGNANPYNKLTERSEIQPMNAYGISKLECEKLVQEWGSSHSQFQYLILRYFNVAGANLELKLGQRTQAKNHIFHVLSDCALNNKKLLINGRDYRTADGTCVRDYIHVQDVATINRLAVDYMLSDTGSYIINCGYGEEMSVLRAAQLFMKVNQIEIEIEFAARRRGDPDYLVADRSTLEKVLGWKAEQAHPEIEIARSAYLWQSYYQSTL